MSYLADLAQDIASAEAFDVWRQDGTTADAAKGTGAQRAAALLAVEVLQASAFAAIVASVLNALERDRFPNLDPNLVQTFLPASPMLAQGACDRATLGGEDVKLSLAIANYHLRLELALRLAHRWRPGGGEGPEVPADAWRRFCGVALDLEQTLVDRAGGSLAGLTWLERAPTRAALLTAAEGGWPCLDPNGLLSVPGWAERRRETRHAVSTLVTVVAGALSAAGRLIDRSDHGMQIETALDVQKDATVRVVLPDQSRHTGIVRWSRDGRIGIEFATPVHL